MTPSSFLLHDGQDIPQDKDSMTIWIVITFFRTSLHARMWIVPSYVIWTRRYFTHIIHNLHCSYLSSSMMSKRISCWLRHLKFLYVLCLNQTCELVRISNLKFYQWHKLFRMKCQRKHVSFRRNWSDSGQSGFLVDINGLEILAQSRVLSSWVV